MSFLGSKKIRDEKAKLFKNLGKFDEKYLKQSSYDLRLGAEVYVVGEAAPRSLSEKEPYLILTPGQFAILTCYEDLKLDAQIMAFITLRNRYKMQGLVNVSGFHVDPTFEEKLVFAVQNVGPSDIRLKFQEPTFTIFFAHVDENDQAERETPRTGIELRDIQQLGGNTITLAKLQKDIEQVRTMMLVYAPFAVAATAALVIALIKK
ncbi:MAG: dCTP deaminase domain-containing protein [Terriglobales bacterium]